MTRRPDQRAAGFTLVELLVVVSVVALLIGILVPALGAARERTEFIACRAQLKQISTAVITYAQDYKQAIPFGPGRLAIGSSAGDFYRVEGMVTSLVANLNGDPVGLGLAVESYLSSTPEVIFCPGSDQTVIAEDELAKFGTDQVQSSFWYRHGSTAYPGDLPLKMKLSGSYKNRNGDTIQALAMDTNFLADAPLAAFGVSTRTHHQAKRLNVMYLDGGVGGLENTDGDYSANVGSDPSIGPDLMLKAFEAADVSR